MENFKKTFHSGFQSVEIASVISYYIMIDTSARRPKSHANITNKMVSEKATEESIKMQSRAVIAMLTQNMIGI